MVVGKRKRGTASNGREKRRSIKAQPLLKARASTRSKVEAEANIKAQAAMQAIFDTAELLENILVFCDFYTLLTSQRVSTAFRDTINSSLPIRQKLFLAPIESNEKWAVVGDTIEDLHFIKITPSTVLPPPLTVDHLESDWPLPRDISPARLNPLLTLDRKGTIDSSVGSERQLGLAAAYTMLQMSDCKLSHDLHGYSQNASWRKMYLCNPPAVAVEAQIMFETQRSPLHSVKVSVQTNPEEPEDLTFGTLFDRAMDEDIVEYNGKKCRKGGNGTAAKTVKQDEKHDGPVYIPASSHGRKAFDMVLFNVVAVDEEEWQEVEEGATRGVRTRARG